MTAEGREADISFAAGAKAYSRGADYVGTIEQGFEELPRTHSLGGAHPDIGCVLTTIDLETEGTQALQHMLGIVHVIVDGFLNLLFAFR